MRENIEQPHVLRDDPARQHILVVNPLVDPVEGDARHPACHPLGCRLDLAHDTRKPQQAMRVELTPELEEMGALDRAARAPASGGVVAEARIVRSIEPEIIEQMPLRFGDVGMLVDDHRHVIVAEGGEADLIAEDVDRRGVKELRRYPTIVAIIAAEKHIVAFGEDHPVAVIVFDPDHARLLDFERNPRRAPR